MHLFWFLLLWTLLVLVSFGEFFSNVCSDLKKVEQINNRLWGWDLVLLVNLWNG